MLRSRIAPFGAALLVLSALSTAARAEIQSGVPEAFPSKQEISAHLGFQAGFGAQLGSTSGFKLDAEYAYKFHPYIWFDANLTNVFGFGAADGVCTRTFAAQCYRGGWALGLLGGVKLKFPTRIPLVIEAPILVGVEVLYNRDCSDGGAAVPLFKTGGGAKYFLTRRIAVGAKLDVAFAPAFHGAGSPVCKNESYTDFYGYFDFMIGAEFILGG